jgi:hypothetical protein
MLGLLSGLHTETAEPAACQTGRNCVGPGISAGMTPLLEHCGVGLALGAAAGVLLALAIRPSR